LKRGLGELLFPNSKTSDEPAKLRQYSYCTAYWNTGNRESIAGGSRDFLLKHSVKTDDAAQAFHQWALVKVKGKATPLEAWTGPEGSRWLRLPDFKTIST
jgi:hypothetical protein